MQQFIQAVELIGEIILVLAIGTVGYLLYHQHKIAEEQRLTLAAKRRKEHYLAEQEKHKSLAIVQQNALLQADYELRRFQMQLAVNAQSMGGTFEWTAHGFRASGAPVKVVESAPAHPQLVPVIDAPLTLPGPSDFAEHIELWKPTVEQILVAIGPGGTRITVPLKALCHVALAGATGNGKSVIMRLLLSQILYVGAKVALADPHFASIDPESGEDWRPIASRLAVEPCVSYKSIKDMLLWMADEELPKRLKLRSDGKHPGQPFFLAIDELPAIVAKVPEAPDAMATILREGRKVGLYLVSAAQDWLVKTVGGTGGVRDCFRTAFYVGGDATSARVLLDVKGTVDDGGLGKGLVMLRCSATQKAALSRVPYASNDALFELLGYPSGPNTDKTPAFPHTHQPTSTNAEHRNRIITGALVEDVRPLGRAGEGNGEFYQDKEPVVSLTNAERTTILIAAHAQMRLTGKATVNRSQLIRDMNAVDKSWNNKSWDKVKQVLDEEGL